MNYFILEIPKTQWYIILTYLHEVQIFTNAALLALQNFHDSEIHEPELMLLTSRKIYEPFVVHIMQLTTTHDRNLCCISSQLILGHYEYKSNFSLNSGVYLF